MQIDLQLIPAELFDSREDVAAFVTGEAFEAITVAAEVVLVCNEDAAPAALLADARSTACELVADVRALARALAANPRERLVFASDDERRSGPALARLAMVVQALGLNASDLGALMAFARECAAETGSGLVAA